jgi:hypothetical protein
MSVPFTQFVRPDAHQRQISIDVSVDAQKKANVLLKAGCTFDAELLTMQSHIGDDEVTFACMSADGETCMGIQICRNGHGNRDAIERMIDEAYEYFMDEGLQKAAGKEPGNG